MLLKQTSLLMKNLSIYCKVAVPLHQSQVNCGLSSQNSIRTFLTNDNQVFSSAGTKDVKPPLPEPPKQGMSNKEKFVRAGEEWRNLSQDKKDSYKKISTDAMVQYRKEMTTFLESMTPEAMIQFKKLKREKIRDKTRSRIKTKLRTLKYPKRPSASYIFFIKDQLQKEYPDGVYPAVKTPDHIRWIGIWSQRWRNMSLQEKLPYRDLAEKDRQRYFSELEMWKQELGKPENEENLLQLERLSRKIESTQKSEEEIKKKQKNAASRIIRERVASKKTV